jgi:hypothetical protein
MGEYINKVDEKTDILDQLTFEQSTSLDAVPPEQTPPVSLRRSYENAHAYHINSISTCSDGETFISADDLRINWWNYDISDTCFSKSFLNVLFVSFYLFSIGRRAGFKAE